MKSVLMFSGQGAQSVGMAKTLYENFPSVRELFDRADAALGFGLSKLCFEGPEEELTKTNICQPALYLHGFAVVEVLRQKGMLGDVVSAIGLSLGELTAHAFAGTYSFEAGLKIVEERGRLMQLACDSSRGAMASFIGADAASAAEYCQEFGIDMSNLNCPGQVVVSGEEERVAAAVAAAKERKAFKMVVPLKVAGAYHSRLMKPAQIEFEKFLAGIEFKKPSVKVFTNVTGAEVDDPEEIKRMLVRQVVSTVRWEDCVRAAAALGADQFYECGPGGVLGGMCKRIDRALSVRSLAELPDFA